MKRAFQLSCCGAALFICMALLSIMSGSFDYELADLEKPVLTAVTIMVVAGFIFLMSAFRIREGDNGKSAIFMIILFGIAMRIVFFWSVPICEDDHFRYLWDGAMTANGFNPYALSPLEVKDAQPGVISEDIQMLAHDAQGIIERINYPWLRSIYPPLAQAAFAASHLISPWSLVSWRVILLFADFLTLFILWRLVRGGGLSLSMLAVYWWNPILIKEIYNSAHMDVLLFPFLAGALFLAWRERHMSSSLVLGCAAAIKFWPIILLPVVLRPLAKRVGLLLGCVFTFFSVFLILLAPQYMTGLDESSGLMAYGRFWEMNDSVFMLILWPLEYLWSEVDFVACQSHDAARLAVAAILAGWTIFVIRRDDSWLKELNSRFLYVTAALFLLSPTQFPWYATWLMPFLVLEPRFSLLLMTALLPLYYVRFYLDARGLAHLHDRLLVWVQFAPVWVIISIEWIKGKRRGTGYHETRLQ